MPNESTRISLPFGQGLDRETGVMAMRPGTFEDIRNLLLHQGKAIIRPGFDLTAILLDDEGTPATQILQGHALRSERIGVVVSYNEDTEKVWVHRVDSLGVTAELVGEWENDREWGDQVPQVSMTEVYGRVFMAHSTRYVLKRASTIYYDPINGVTPLSILQGDFEATGDHDIRFRGVKRHLKYLFGWGYGDESEDRPELVRSSRAGDPTSFNPEHYFIAGDRRDPVLTCLPAGNRLLVFKEVEAHQIFGHGRDDFGIDILDPQYGCIGSHLAANRGGMVVAWSSEGPRVWDGRGPSEEIAIPLELSGAEPVGLAAEGDEETAFAAYVPDLRVMAFFFGQRVYGLTTRVEGDWKWSYWELPFEPLCGFTLFPGPQDTTAPEGYPQISLIVSGGTYSDITIKNIDQDGDETVEYWLTPDPGTWFLKKSFLVATTSLQTVRITGLVPGTDYTIAARYRRGTLYAPQYEDPDPDTWPQVSRADFNTSISPPTWVSGAWERTSGVSEQITVTVDPAVGLESQDIKVYRNTVLVHTITGPHVGPAIWVDTGITGETDVVYEFVTVGGSGDSIKSDPETVWAGPLAIPELIWVQNQEESGADQYEVRFTPADVANPTEIHDNYDDAGGVNPGFALRFTVSAGLVFGISPSLAGIPVAPGVTIYIKARQKETLFAVDDFSDLSTLLPLDMYQV